MRWAAYQLAPRTLLRGRLPTFLAPSRASPQQPDRTVPPGTDAANIPPAPPPSGDADAAMLRRLLAASAVPGPFSTGPRMPNAAPPVHRGTRPRHRPAARHELIPALDGKGRLRLPIAVAEAARVPAERDGALVTVFLPGRGRPRPGFAAAALPLEARGRLTVTTEIRREVGIPDGPTCSRCSTPTGPRSP